MCTLLPSSEVLRICPPGTNCLDLIQLFWVCFEYLTSEISGSLWNTFVLLVPQRGCVLVCPMACSPMRASMLAVPFVPVTVYNNTLCACDMGYIGAFPSPPPTHTHSHVCSVVMQYDMIPHVLPHSSQPDKPDYVCIHMRLLQCTYVCTCMCYAFLSYVACAPAGSSAVPALPPSPCTQEHTSVSRKHRTPFTLDEEDYVIQGVAKFGKRWRHVLSSFPFNSSRTVVDIKDKYRNLKARSIAPGSWQ